MAKRKSSKNENDEKKSFWVTLPGILTAITALITAIAGLVAALNTMGGLFAPDATPSPIPPSITSVPTVAQTPTPAPPPTFTTRYVLYSSDETYSNVEQVEFQFESGTLPDETIQDFIHLSRIAYGFFESSDDGFNIELILRNTGDQPLLLDLTERFFSMVDDRGRAAELIYFCCASNRDILQAGRERTIQLFFRAPPGWAGKEVSASYINIRVDGLLPQVRVVWQIPSLAVAN